jgi:hypothetical protein
VLLIIIFRLFGKKSKHFLQLSFLCSSLGVIVSSNVLSLDKYIWNRFLTCHFEKSHLEFWAVVANLIKLVHRVLDSQTIEKVLCFGAERTVTFAEDDNVIRFNLRLGKIVLRHIQSRREAGILLRANRERSGRGGKNSDGRDGQSGKGELHCRIDSGVSMKGNEQY